MFTLVARIMILIEHTFYLVKVVQSSLDQDIIVNIHISPVFRTSFVSIYFNLVTSQASLHISSLKLTFSYI